MRTPEGLKTNGDISHELARECIEPNLISIGLLMHGTTSLAFFGTTTLFYNWLEKHFTGSSTIVIKWVVII